MGRMAPGRRIVSHIPKVRTTKRGVGHTVSFTAQDGWLVASCGCGWIHKWNPNNEVHPAHYGKLFAYGLDHSRTNTSMRNKEVLAS